MPRIISPCKGCEERKLTEAGAKACGEHDCEKFRSFRQRYKQQADARYAHVTTQFCIKKVQYNGLTKTRRKK